jgi:5,10-methylene-tetrahydrofolate dehydrogenase/methenyl tetrahydrofolate cyclohydrolase
LVEQLDCKTIARNLKSEVAAEVSKYKESFGSPKTSFILVGYEAYSLKYVELKAKACTDLGIETEIYNLSENITENHLLKLINGLNNDPKVNGIVVQLPIPEHINEFRVKNAIKREKDVDGLSAENLYNSVFGIKGHIPCVAASVLYILNQYEVDPKGKTVVIVGQSDVISKPLLNVFANLECDVIFADHSSEVLESLVGMGDILVTCCNMAHVINGKWIKKDSMVFDAGNSTVIDKNKENTYTILGDVFVDENCKARFITPVPGGIGPVGIAMLCYNILNAYKEQFIMRNISR